MLKRGPCVAHLAQGNEAREELQIGIVGALAQVVACGHAIRELCLAIARELTRQLRPAPGFPALAGDA